MPIAFPSLCLLGFQIGVLLVNPGAGILLLFLTVPWFAPTVRELISHWKEVRSKRELREMMLAYQRGKDPR